MTRDKKKIIDALKAKGFTGNFQLFFWNKDGWYCQCDQLNHEWLGQNSSHAVGQINKGFYDKWLY